MGLFKSLFYGQISEGIDLNLLQVQPHENVEKFVIELAYKMVEQFNKIEKTTKFAVQNYGQNASITFEGVMICNIILHEDDNEILVLNYKGDYVDVFDNAVTEYKKIAKDLEKSVIKALKNHPEVSNIAAWSQYKHLHMRHDETATEDVTSHAQMNIAKVNGRIAKEGMPEKNQEPHEVAKSQN